MGSAEAACATGELLAVLLARDLADHETAIIGTNSDIQLAACRLAQETHAPRLTWFSGPGGMVNPQVNRLLPTADADNIETAEAWFDLPVMVDYIDWRIHFFDFAILGALQVDRFGNLNTVVLGEHAKPKLRGPGTVGIAALTGLARRYYIVLTRHDRGVFVPRLDFRCAPGYLEGGNSREEYGLPPGGPKLVVTPLGVFDFEPRSKAMRVHSLHPGVSLEQVRDATGFELLVEGTPPVTRMPSAQELEVLRSRVDSAATLRAKFA